jgi:hypothetical protein
LIVEEGFIGEIDQHGATRSVLNQAQKNTRNEPLGSDDGPSVSLHAPIVISAVMV